MNIRSIDLQVLIPHATEVGRTQHIANQQNGIQQQDFASQWQRISQERQKQVQLVDQTDNGKVNEKKDSSGSRRNQEEPKKRQRKVDSQAQQQQAAHLSSDCQIGGKIDIKT